MLWPLRSAGSSSRDWSSVPRDSSTGVPSWRVLSRTRPVYLLTLVVCCLMLEGFQEVEEVNGVKICTRSGGVVQQIPKEQWFLNCEEMNADVMKALDQGVVSKECWYPAH